MAAKTLSVEETNHLRTVYLCYRVAPEAVRAYFDKQHPPPQLVQDLTKEKKKLKKIKGNILKQYQWNQLFPHAGSPPPVSTVFDITLLICLLRNMNPVISPPPMGFDKLPHSSHTTDGAHVARIKYYRNNLAHSTDGKLSNTDFANFWSDLELAITGLGGSQFGKDITDAKTRSLDNSLAEILHEMAESQKLYNEFLDDMTNTISNLRNELAVVKHDDKERTADFTKKIYGIQEELDQRVLKLEETLKQLSDKITTVEGEMYDLGLNLCEEMEYYAMDLEEFQKTIAELKMETIPENRRALITMHLDNWKEADKMFIKTRAADEVYTMIKANNCLTVTGNSGIGKTMAVRHVALKILEEGYIIVPISHPEEIVTLFSTQRKILFVVDDLCGKYTLNQGYLDRLKLKLEDIKLILDKHHCKLIATCRLQVHQDVKFKTLSIFNMCKCNISSKDLYLTSKEITTFAAKYFGEHTKKAKSLSEQYDCFPLLCSLYHKNKGADFDVFCKNPFKFFGVELDNLLLEGDEGKYKYCALALCVIYNNKLSESCFEGTIDRNTREIFEGVLEVCELNRGTSPKCLHKSLQTLVGTFVTKEEHSYRMIHDKLFDFIAFYLGQKMIHILIKHADSGFIRERFLWNTVDNKEDEVDFTISISEAVVDSYIDRMIKDLTNRKVVDFFDNRNLKSSVFTDKVIFHFNELDNDRRLELASVLDDGRYHDTPLMRSSFTGNMKLTQWIFNHGADVNQCNELDKLSPLQLACQEGYLQIARHLLQHGADINKCNVDGWSPLHAACACDHKDVVTELLKNDKVKINVCTNDGRSPLYMACERGYDKIVRELLHLRPDINQHNKNGISPLNIACCNGYKHVVVALLTNHTLKVDSCDMDGYSSLYLACQKGYAQIVGDLVQRGADINKLDSHGFSPLHTACYNGHKEVVSELLENDSVKIDFSVNMGCSSLYLACQEGYEKIVRDLLKHGADINKRKDNLWSPLHTACYKGHLDVVTELLNSDNVTIDLCDNEGCSSLYLACQQGYVQIVRTLCR